MIEASPSMVADNLARSMIDPTDEAKAGVRAQMRAKLAAMSDEDRHLASTLACTRLVNLDEFKQASVIMLYLPLEREVDATAAALRGFQMGKTICVPWVDWQRRDMYAIEIRSFDQDHIKIDEHGVRSPKRGTPIVPGSIDLVVVPGLAFDAHRNRLGRGRGFYDRFLTRLRPAAVTAGLAFDCQVIDDVPVGDRDLRVRMVVTDRRLTRVRRSRSRH